jgi:hypothetical protein
MTTPAIKPNHRDIPNIIADMIGDVDGSVSQTEREYLSNFIDQDEDKEIVCVLPDVIFQWESNMRKMQGGNTRRMMIFDHSQYLYQKVSDYASAMNPARLGMPLSGEAPKVDGNQPIDSQPFYLTVNFSSDNPSSPMVTSIKAYLLLKNGQSSELVGFSLEDYYPLAKGAYQKFAEYRNGYPETTKNGVQEQLNAATAKLEEYLTRLLPKQTP